MCTCWYVLVTQNKKPPLTGAILYAPSSLEFYIGLGRRRAYDYITFAHLHIVLHMWKRRPDGRLNTMVLQGGLKMFERLEKIIVAL